MGLYQKFENNFVHKFYFIIIIRKNRVLAKAIELGIPSALVDKFIGLTDEETDAGLKALAETVIPYRDSAVSAALEKIGSQPSPKGGQSGVKTMALAEFNKLDGKAQNAFMGGGDTIEE